MKSISGRNFHLGVHDVNVYYSLTLGWGEQQDVFGGIHLSEMQAAFSQRAQQTIRTESGGLKAAAPRSDFLV